jgi:hypothetical protein
MAQTITTGTTATTAAVIFGNFVSGNDVEIQVWEQTADGTPTGGTGGNSIHLYSSISSSQHQVCEGARARACGWPRKCTENCEIRLMER